MNKFAFIFTFIACTMHCSANPLPNCAIGKDTLCTATDVDVINIEELYKAQKCEFDAFTDSLQNEYDNFWKSLCAKYAEFMKNPWKEIELIEPKPLPPDPKPVIKDEVIQNDVVVIDNVIPKPIVTPQPKPVVPIFDDKNKLKTEFFFNFYGTTASVNIPDVSGFNIDYSSSDPYGNALLQLDNIGFNSVANDLLKIRDDYDLCDWAYKDMVKDFAHSLCNNDKDKANLIYGWLMTLCGYKVRFAMFTPAGENSPRLTVAYSTDAFIYDKASLFTDALYFIDEKFKSGSAYMCDFNIKGEKPLSFIIQKEPKFTIAPSDERIVPITNAPGDTISAKTNVNYIRFLDTYPKASINYDWATAWSIAANIPMSSYLKSQIYPQIKEHIKDLDTPDAIQYLNQIAQSFEYGSDDEIWGGDYPLAVDQTWFHPASDCEDHAIHFSRLVRDLIGIDVVLLYVPQHLIAAVELGNMDIEGTRIQYNGKQYLICDPTYFGTKIGRTFVKFDSTNSTIIPLN
ncbi:MAG: hypothetical protein ACI30M_05750 [Muribaculaceae bacterium]